jgi:hypothetical protein
MACSKWRNLYGVLHGEVAFLTKDARASLRKGGADGSSRWLSGDVDGAARAGLGSSRGGGFVATVKPPSNLLHLVFSEATC